MFGDIGSKGFHSNDSRDEGNYRSKKEKKVLVRGEREAGFEEVVATGSGHSGNGKEEREFDSLDTRKS